jgi:hypothetical protein
MKTHRLINIVIELNIVLSEKVRSRSYKLLSYSYMEGRLKEISSTIRRE